MANKKQRIAVMCALLAKNPNKLYSLNYFQHIFDLLPADHTCIMLAPDTMGEVCHREEFIFLSDTLKLCFYHYLAFQSAINASMLRSPVASPSFEKKQPGIWPLSL